MLQPNNKNIENIQEELKWLEKIIELRFQHTFEKVYYNNKINKFTDYDDIESIIPPLLQKQNSAFAQFIHKFSLPFHERLLLILAFAPHVAPELLDKLLGDKKDAQGRNLCELGGVRGNAFRGFLPTGLTFLFLAAGYNLAKRIHLISQLSQNHFLLLKQEIIKFLPHYPGEPLGSGVLVLDDLRIALFLNDTVDK